MKSEQAKREHSINLQALESMDVEDPRGDSLPEVLTSSGRGITISKASCRQKVGIDKRKRKQCGVFVICKRKPDIHIQRGLLTWFFYR